MFVAKRTNLAKLPAALLLFFDLRPPFIARHCRLRLGQLGARRRNRAVDFA
jgi:hypothetical protein